MKEKWSIKIKVIRLWTTPDFYNPENHYSIEMVFVDEKGDKVQATVKRSLLLRFGPILHEGSVYSISRFGVGQPNVIGGVTEVSKLEITERNGKMNKRLELEFEDLELNCTLWGEFADIMTTYLSTHHGNPIIIIIQFAKIKTWKGVRCLSSSLFATKLLINENIGDIEDFKKSGEKSSSSILTRVDSYSTHTTEDEFLQSSIKKRIDDIRETQEVSTCVTLATIICIESSHGWWYKACKKDLKKIKEIDVEGKKRLWCDKCNAYVDDVNARFKLQIRVVDETGNASFVLFDREVAQIIGKSAVQLRESCHSKIDDDDSIPDELNKIMDKKYLFKIKISEYNLQQRWPVEQRKNDDDDNSEIC
ncbi:Replication protein A 70 kDa DNA-binding subunit C [Bienertia sinuspersici]